MNWSQYTCGVTQLRSILPSLHFPSFWTNIQVLVVDWLIMSNFFLKFVGRTEHIMHISGFLVGKFWIKRAHSGPWSNLVQKRRIVVPLCKDSIHVICHPAKKFWRRLRGLTSLRMRGIPSGARCAQRVLLPPIQGALNACSPGIGNKPFIPPEHRDSSGFVPSYDTRTLSWTVSAFTRTIGLLGYRKNCPRQRFWREYFDRVFSLNLIPLV